ncbi:hypothetical protein H5410_001444, partial [Solanum commersonii]
SEWAKAKVVLHAASGCPRGTHLIRAPQILADPLAEQLTNAEFQAAFQVLAQAMMAQANRESMVPVNPNMGTMATRVREFTRMNPSEFHSSNVEEDPQEFIDEVYKDISKVWFNQWKEERVVDVGPLDREKIKVAFLDKFFILEIREAKISLAKMSKFVSGVFEIVVKECRTAMLI